MNTAQESKTETPFHKMVVDTLMSVGVAWASYGLKVGQKALVTSAETLEKTAETLDTLAVNLKKSGAVDTASTGESTPLDNAVSNENKAPAAAESAESQAPGAAAS
ncbi:MAG: hypothetical protein IPK82_01205 [Polyangiaceae bacterium]|nr:hypothetical protein [Polyangiaceae bacterium]